MHCEPLVREGERVLPGRILFIADDFRSFAELSHALERRGITSQWHRSAQSALAALGDDDLHLVVVETCLTDMDGIELCQRIMFQRPDVRVILVASAPRFETALAALRAGAFDCFVEPIDPLQFAQSLERATRQSTLREQVKRLRMALAETRGFEELIGASPPMQQLYDLLARAAGTSASVLITGESGTGKELVARALHRRSARRSGPFVAVNCSAIPPNLIESELFGHVKGAFTDAKAARSGLFAKASGGTIFLDEIGDMPREVQPKLLRALQERTVRPVGGDLELPFDARVIAATNRNLEAAVAESRFREDLFYRINVIHIDVPPLRERASDVLLIAQHFVAHYALHTSKTVVGLSPGAAERLLAYPWPGNIRELQNCIERAVALTRQHELQVDDLPVKIASYCPSPVLMPSNDSAELVPMEEVERRYIMRVLQAVQGNKKEAAKVLGFDRKTLYRKLERYGVIVERGAPKE